MKATVKYLLPEAEMPKSWYNIVADLPEPPPPVLHPGTGQPGGPDDLAPLFPMEQFYPISYISIHFRKLIPVNK